MPFGLPFIARPGQEGFDAYGRMIPPDLPEGWDGWGRPIISGNPQPPIPPPAAAAMPLAANTVSPNTRDDMPSTVPPNSSTTESTGRPDQPSCFDRPPAQTDSYFRYDPFEAFSLPAAALNRAWELHLPRELVSHDVGEDDWKRFINDLSTEALQSARHDWISRRPTIPGRGPNPSLSDAVHALIASWAVAFFAPRGIKIYAASGGSRVIPRPVEPPLASKRGHDRADEWSDASSTLDDDDDEIRQEMEDRRADAHYPRVERIWRQNERERERRRARKRRGNERLLGGARPGADGDWEVCFVHSTPTLWTPGARPRTYGEPVVRLRR
ncbi:hypothetical protein BCR39DRAFT_497755 [Naematelia encephala]|uniref:Uncharacterized protein n=1 Tax=Naematelia encephala TaxID=71784 RepID=A0A1Y2AWE2_9TREE|nr:hypothetical protein BCR39DRAFT_497755 [Naematelia encephala]